MKGEPEFNELKNFLTELLTKVNRIESYDVSLIIYIAYQHCQVIQAANESPEMQIRLLKTAFLEFVRDSRYGPDSVKDCKRKFDESIQSLFDGKNPKGLSYCASVTRQLYQYRLGKTYDAREIITEAYTRGVKKIESGELIENPCAWLRTTCLFVIREFRRKQDKAVPRLDNEELWSPGDTVFSDFIKQEDILAIRAAFCKLGVDDQRLISKRVIEGMSWQAIAESLTNSESEPLKVGTVRQRGARAFERLRQQYEVIRECVSMTDD